MKITIDIQDNLASEVFVDGFTSDDVAEWLMARISFEFAHSKASGRKLDIHPPEPPAGTGKE